MSIQAMHVVASQKRISDALYYRAEFNFASAACATCPVEELVDWAEKSETAYTRYNLALGKLTEAEFDRYCELRISMHA